MKISVIITTYNREDALEVVIKSILKQTLKPSEIIIADDGSGQETSLLIQSLQEKSPIPIQHSWQADKGFRAAESRNKALAKSTGEYIIIIDGDIFLPKNFIKDHCTLAKPGYFIQGGRVSLGEKASHQLIEKEKLPKIYQAGIKNRKNMLHCKFLSNFFSRTWNSDASTRSCNMSFWRRDIINVNGFNNEFVGWGKEDSELVIRLLNSGIQRHYVKFLAAGYHLYHPENPRESLQKNKMLYEEAKRLNLSRCENGLDKFT